MITIDSALDYLKKSKEPQEFDVIFEEVKDKLPKIHEDENEMKAELWNGLISSIQVIKISNTQFDLRERYSLEEVNRINRLNAISEDIEKEEEE